MAETTPEAKGAYLVNPQGQTARVPLDQVPELLDSDWTPATPEQAAPIQKQRQLQAEHGDLASQVQTVGESLGDTATFGLFGHALNALGSDPEARAARAEANPVAHGLGIAGGLLLPGGAAKVIGRAGAGAAAVAEGLLPEATTLLGKAARGGAKSLLSGAVEGGLFSAGNVVSESALDPNMTSQAAAAEIGLGSLLGGGIGGILGAAGQVIPAAVGKAKEVAAGAFKKGEGALGDFYKAGEAVTGTPSDVASLMMEHRLEIAGLDKAIPGVGEDIANATPDMAKWIVDKGERLKEMETAFPGTTRQLARTSPETADYLLNNWQKIITDPQKRIGVAQGLASEMQKVVDSTNAVMRRVNTDLAPREAEALLAGHTGESTELAYAKLTDDVRNAVLKMRAEPELYSQGYARQLEGFRDGLIRDLTDSINPVEAFKRMRTLRQSMDEAIPYTKDMGALGISERNALKVMKDLRGQVKATLTDPQVFGQAAARQAALDSAQSEWLALTKRGGDFNTKFMRKVTGKGGVSYELKPTKLNTWLNQMADARGQDFATTWGRTMDAAKALVSEAEQSYKTAPVGQFDRAALDSLISRSEKLTGEAKEAASVTQMKNQLDPRMSWGSMPVASNPAGGAANWAAHMLLPGMVTSTVKGTMNIARQLSSVPRGVAALTALEAMGQRIAKQIDRGAAALVSGTEKAGRVATGPLAAHVAHSAGERIEQVQRLVQNPEAFQQALIAHTDDVHEHAPQTAQALQIHRARQVSFLASKVPQVPSTGPLGPKLELNHEQAWKFNRYFDAVEKPTSILDHAAQGTLTPMDVEAVRETSPDLHQKMMTAALDKVTDRKGPLPYRSRLMLFMLMGHDLDGTLSPAAIQANQAAYQRPSQKSPLDQTGPAATGRPNQTGLGKLKVSSRAMTPGQAIESRAGEM